MARLYWRVKKNGKWTWTPVSDENTLWCCDESIEFKAYIQEEEE